MLPARYSSETRYFVQTKRRSGEAHQSSKALVGPSSLTVAGCQRAVASKIASLQKEAELNVCIGGDNRNDWTTIFARENSMAPGEAMLKADWPGFRAAITCAVSIASSSRIGQSVDVERQRHREAPAR